MNCAGLVEGKQHHHLDHIAPLCALEEIPLILTDDELFDLAQKYYPDLEALYFPPHQAPDALVSAYDTIIVSTPRVLFDQIYYLSQALHGKQVRTIWCPHGNSDKGKSVPFFEALADEELLLTYGPKMERFIREKGITVPFHQIGNYRYAYYQKHRDFYDQLLPPKTEKTILYAPTWQDAESLSSFPHVWKELLTPPEGVELLIKLHPNLYEQYPDEIAELRKHHKLIENFPPIYPLLARTDLLIGDHSSINDDFLVFNCPIFQWKPGSPSLFGEGSIPDRNVDDVFAPYSSLTVNLSNRKPHTR